MISNCTEAVIPPESIERWQRIVDLLANIMDIPSAVVCKLEPPSYSQYAILASSKSDKNPFPVDDTFSMDIGTFCETVIKSREPLLVVNALEDDKWKHAPELQVGMISYLGLPVFWPDGQVFGTICVLDNKANPYSEHYKELLLQCCDVLQADLETIVRLSYELDDQKTYLGELFARVPEAVVMINREFEVMRANPGFTKLFGYTADEAVGQRITELIAPDILGEDVERFLNRMLISDEAFDVETVCAHTSGTHIPVSAICVAIPSIDRDKAGYLIFRDLTDTKRLLKEQRRFQEIQLELAHANRIATLAQLSASIAHELNQPLTGIITNCGACLQMMTNIPQELHGAREAVRRTMRDGKRASQVVERLRALFSNKEPVCEPVDLNFATQEMLALTLADLQNGGIDFRTELANELPLVFADRVQVQQVILNLLRNALDAMDTINDRPRDLLIKTDRLGDDRVQLSVKDAGVGFDPQIMAKLFQAFYSTKSVGMGVGLAVSRSIIEAHHGSLWATLNDGPGATFAFSIPTRASLT